MPLLDLQLCSQRKAPFLGSRLLSSWLCLRHLEALTSQTLSIASVAWRG